MVAEHLGMMVWQVEEEMPIDEFFQWLAFLSYKRDLEEKAIKKAKSKRR